MNTAEAIDLESVLQLLRRESRAVLDYRGKRGQLSSLDDLKGLDPAIFKKIEAKKIASSSRHNPSNERKDRLTGV